MVSFGTGHLVKHHYHGSECPIRYIMGSPHQIAQISCLVAMYVSISDDAVRANKLDEYFLTS
jgi:hypothetical protein